MIRAPPRDSLLPNGSKGASKCTRTEVKKVPSSAFEYYIRIFSKLKWKNAVDRACNVLIRPLRYLIARAACKETARCAAATVKRLKPLCKARSPRGSRQEQRRGVGKRRSRRRRSGRRALPRAWNGPTAAGRTLTRLWEEVR